MKKYAVLRQISTYAPDVMRMFDNDADAHTFARLCRESEENKFTTFAVYGMD